MLFAGTLGRPGISGKLGMSSRPGAVLLTRADGLEEAGGTATIVRGMNNKMRN